MPTLSVARDDLYNALGCTYTEKEFDELCFEFGVELDEVTSDRQEAKKNKAGISQKELMTYSDQILYKIDVPANRYDLLCLEGMVRALKIFLQTMESPVYRVLDLPPESSGTREVCLVRTSHVEQARRPFVVCAVLRDLSFDQLRYNSFIDLQDQLHRNLCRHRTLVAIGTHDRDSIAGGPYVYDARPPKDIKFRPLTHSDDTDESSVFAADDLLELYTNDPTYKHLKPYVPILRDGATGELQDVVPVVLDREGMVLSLPPIINSAASRITLDTKNVFIECTATDLTKANVVLDTVVAMFSEYCVKPFTVEPVEVKYVNDDDSVRETCVTPLMSTRTTTAPVDFVNGVVGVNLDADTMADLCRRVQLSPAEVLRPEGPDGPAILEVTVPPTRSDILHAVDVAEDVAVAYGYNKIVRSTPTTGTVGGEQPLNKASDLLRDEIGRAGYMEVLTHGLCSVHDVSVALRRPYREGGVDAVTLSNPANVEYQVVRTTLLPGLLKVLQHNKSASFANGFRVFEVSDVVLPDNTHRHCQEDGDGVDLGIVGARNERRVCAIYAGPTSGFEIIHGLVDRVMALMEVGPSPAYVATSGLEKSGENFGKMYREGWTYTIEAGDGSDGMYFPGRSARVVLTRPSSTDPIFVGSFGILHPEVLQTFDILYPATCMELNLEALL